MSRAARVAVVLCASAGLGLWAAEFWEKKKFAEWNEKETKQMMTNSPWAKRVDVPLGSPSVGAGRGSRGGGRSRGGGGLGGGGAISGADVTGGGAGLGGMDAPGRMPGEGGSEGVSVPTLPLLIRWHSSLPIKQALAKGRWGAEAATSQEAAKLLGRQEQYYIVVISGLPGRVLQGGPAQKLKESTFLKIGKSQSIVALDVQVNPGTPVSDVILVFPRSQPGAHLITLEDKEVEVVSQIGPLDVRRKFRLKDMVFDGKLEL